MNSVILSGRLTAAPELKATASGTNVTTFCIAVDRRYQSKDGEKITDFINCVAWRNIAEFICKYFKKGEPITVRGEIQTRKYTDKNNNNRVAVEVVIEEAHFVPKTNSNNTNDAPPVDAAFDEINDDELPF